jgi:predicted CoA-binding protein
MSDDMNRDKNQKTAIAPMLSVQRGAQARQKEEDMSDPKQILEAAQTILLVDWPNPGVPRALLRAGFTVFSYSPDRYSAAEMVAEHPHDVDHENVFPPRNEHDTGYLVFRPLAGRPDAVDIVNVYRPVEEMAGIVVNHVLPLGAKALWLQSPAPSAEGAEAHSLAREHGLVFIGDRDIAEIARTLGDKE